MPIQDKVLLMHKVEETLKPRMFANYLEEAMREFTVTLDEFDVIHISNMDGTANEDCLEAYLNVKKIEGRSEKTIIRYAYIITRFLLWAKVNTREVNTQHIRAYLKAEHDRGVLNSTLEGTRQILNAYFSWLEHEKMIRMNPAFNVEPIKCEKKVKDIFSMADIEKMKRSCKTVRDVAIICFLLSTGCRISEVTQLDRGDINYESGECIVRGKGNKHRMVYLDDVAIMTLREYLAQRRDGSCALFIGKRMERMTSGGVRAMLKGVEEKSGVHNVHPHRFRRTLITRLLNRGMPIQEVAVLVGHDKVDTTMKYYKASSAKIKSSYMKYST